MRVLITGIAGFAGSHLADYLLAQTQAQIWGTVYRRDENIARIKERPDFLRGDLRDTEFVLAALQKSQPDYIFHLAAQSYVPLSFHDPWGTIGDNVLPELNLFTKTLELGFRPRILIVGSNEEYGRVSTQDLPIKETTPLRPDSPYGVSKVAQDLLGLQYYLSHGLQVIRVRPFNHTGPRQREEFVVPGFAKQIAEIAAGLREAVVKVGNLEAKRDFSDVRDVVRAYFLAITKGMPGEVYNIASGAALSIKDVLDGLFVANGQKYSVEVDPTKLRPADAPVSVGDSSKLQKETGWKPQVPFAQTLKDTLEYWLERVAQVKEAR